MKSIRRQPLWTLPICNPWSNCSISMATLTKTMQGNYMPAPSNLFSSIIVKQGMRSCHLTLSRASASAPSACIYLLISWPKRPCHPPVVPPPCTRQISCCRRTGFSPACGVPRCSARWCLTKNWFGLRFP